MPNLIQEIDHNGRTWQLKTDSLGRPYAVAVGLGRVPVDTYKRARANEPLHAYE
jgi:hypothetical protein